MLVRYREVEVKSWLYEFFERVWLTYVITKEKKHGKIIFSWENQNGGDKVKEKHGTGALGESVVSK